MPREIYIDFDNGSNSNAGTSQAAPILNAVGWTPAVGDIVYMRGTLRPSRTDTRAQFAAKLPAWTTLGVKFWPWGKQTWRISGAGQFRGSEWAADTGTTWKVTGLGASFRCAMVTYKYDDESRWVTLMDGITKMPAAFLARAADVATCRSTTNSWFYDGANVLYVNVGLSTAPADNEIEWIFGNPTASNTDNDLNAFTATNAGELDIEGMFGLVDRVGTNSDSDGYGFISYGASTGRVKNLLVREGGYHGAGCVGSGTKNVTFENVRSIGCGVTSTNFIFFSADTANVKGVKTIDCFAGVVPPIKPDGQLLAAVSGMNACYHHTTPGASGSPRIEDVEHRGFIAVTYQPPGANHLDVMGMSAADTLSRPVPGSADEARVSAYNVRCFDSIFIGCGIGAGVNSGYTSAIAFSRTLMVLGNYSSGSPRAINYGYCGWAVDANNSANFPSTILVENSLHIFAFTNGGNEPCFYGAASENCQKRIVIRNVTVIADIEATRAFKVFKAQFAAPTANANTYRIENNLIYKVQGGNVSAFFTAAAADTYATLAASVYQVFDGNIVYFPNGTLTWSDSTAIASTANFTTNFGPRNFINVDPGMPNPRSSPALTPTGFAANIRHPLNPATGRPFNGGSEWEGPGCWNPNGKQLAGTGGLLELMNMVRQAS